MKCPIDPEHHDCVAMDLYMTWPNDYPESPCVGCNQKRINELNNKINIDKELDKMIDKTIIINGLCAIRRFFEIGQPSQAIIFDSYQNVIDGAIELINDQQSQIECRRKVDKEGTKEYHDWDDWDDGCYEKVTHSDESARDKNEEGRYSEEIKDELVSLMIKYLENHEIFSLLELVVSAVATKEHEGR